MFSKKNKPKLSPQQKTEQAEKQNLVNRLRGFVKETLHPFLVENSQSIDDALFFLNICDALIEQALQRKQMEFKISDLDLTKELQQVQNPDRTQKLIFLLKDEKIADAMGLLQGMKNEIQNTVREENKGRLLKDLPIKFL